MINLISQIIPVITFIAGFSFGFYIKTEHKLPEIKSPSKIIKEKKQEIKEEKKRNIEEQYLENIDNYPYNQKDIKE